MEAFIVYLSLSFIFLWIAAFSLSVGSLLWIQLLQFGHLINLRLDEVSQQLNGFMQRLLFYLHLSR